MQCRAITTTAYGLCARELSAQSEFSSFHPTTLSAVDHLSFPIQHCPFAVERIIIRQRHAWFNTVVRDWHGSTTLAQSDPSTFRLAFSIFTTTKSPIVVTGDCLFVRLYLIGLGPTTVHIPLGSSYIEQLTFQQVTTCTQLMM